MLLYSVFFLACISASSSNLPAENNCENKESTECTFGQLTIIFNYVKTVVHSARSFASYISDSLVRLILQTENRQSGYFRDVLVYALDSSPNYILAAEFTFAASTCVNGLLYQGHYPIETERGVHNGFYDKHHPYTKQACVLAAAYDILLKTVEETVMYAVGDTSLYLQINDKNQITVEPLNDNNKERGVNVIRKLFASHDKLSTSIHIGRDLKAWIQVVGMKIMLSTLATSFIAHRIGDYVRFEYKDMLMVYDEQENKIVMISKYIDLPNERFRCDFNEIPVNLYDWF